MNALPDIFLCTHPTPFPSVAQERGARNRWCPDCGAISERSIPMDESAAVWSPCRGMTELRRLFERAMPELVAALLDANGPSRQEPSQDPDVIPDGWLADLRIAVARNIWVVHARHQDMKKLIHAYDRERALRRGPACICPVQEEERFAHPMCLAAHTTKAVGYVSADNELRRGPMMPMPRSS